MIIGDKVKIIGLGDENPWNDLEGTVEWIDPEDSTEYASVVVRVSNFPSLDGTKEIEQIFDRKNLEVISDSEIEEHLVENMADKIIRTTMNYTKDHGQIMCNKGEQEQEVVGRLKANKYDVEVIPVKRGTVAVKYTKKQLKEDKSNEQKIRLIWDDCTPTAERRPTTAEDIEADIHIKEFDNEEDFIEEILSLTSCSEEELEEQDGENRFEKALSLMRLCEDPGDGSTNFIYLSVNGVENDTATYPYECLDGLNLETCSEEDIKDALIGNEDLDEDLNVEDLPTEIEIEAEQLDDPSFQDLGLEETIEKYIADIYGQKPVDWHYYWQDEDIIIVHDIDWTGEQNLSDPSEDMLDENLSQSIEEFERKQADNDFIGLKQDKTLEMFFEPAEGKIWTINRDGDKIVDIKIIEA